MLQNVLYYNSEILILSDGFSRFYKTQLLQLSQPKVHILVLLVDFIV